jgi:hypothetical protein
MTAVPSNALRLTRNLRIDSTRRSVESLDREELVIRRDRIDEHVLILHFLVSASMNLESDRASLDRRAGTGLVCATGAGRSLNPTRARIDSPRDGAVVAPHQVRTP